MKIATLAAAAIFGAGLAFVAPSAEAMPRSTAPVDVTETTPVEKVHRRHCRIIRGHRSRCRRVIRKRHRHRHCHRHRCHRHRHYTGHHGYHGGGYRHRRPRFGIYLGF